MGRKTRPSAKEIANLKPAKPGEVRNPGGRTALGATLKEWLNSFDQNDMTRAEVQAIADDDAAPVAKRAAALRYLRLIERGNLADFEPWLDGKKTLDELRKDGLNVEAVKKAKVTKKVIGTTDDGDEIAILSREIELHDRSGDDFDRVSDRTDGKPRQSIALENNIPAAVQIITPLTSLAPSPADR